MSLTQKQIEFEQYSVSILKLMIQLAEISWTVEKIAFCTMSTKSQVKKCLGGLMEKGTRQGAQKEFVFKNGQAYGITQQGRDYVEGLSLNSAFSTAAGTAKYKEEALSGIVERKSKKTGFMVSEKSKLTRAVLFSHAKHHSSKSPEDFILEQDAIKKARVKIAKQIGITVEELEKAVEEERVKVCKGCGEIEIHHKNLKGLRSKCVKCSKGDRK